MYVYPYKIVLTQKLKPLGHLKPCFFSNLTKKLDFGVKIEPEPETWTSKSHNLTLKST